MKSYVAFLALAALSSAVPTKRQNTCIVQTVMNPSVDDVRNSINQWNDDVTTVNSFLNSAAGLIAANDPNALAAAANTALTNAQDEPCQLMTLISVSDFNPGTDAFECAGQDLMNVFGTHVLDNLNTIISDPADTGAVQTAVDDINSFRCCNVLGDASILWQDAAEDSGIGDQVNVVAPFEDACAKILCTNVCSTEDNGGFGQTGAAQSGV